MKRNRLLPAMSIAFLLGSATSVAQSLDPDRTKKPSASSPATLQVRAVIGTVKAYEPGKTISVQSSDSLATFRLDEKDLTVRLHTPVSVGQIVKVVELRDRDGKMTLTIESQKPGEGGK